MTDDGGGSRAVLEEDVQAQEHTRYTCTETVENLPETTVVSPDDRDFYVRLVTIPDGPQPLEMLPKLVAFVELFTARHGRYPLIDLLVEGDLSVWEDEESLMRFVGRYAHGRVMTDLIPHMGQTKFVQWRVSRSDIPLNWKEARTRMHD
jgi:Domain of unknown function (DUF3291)